MLFLTSTNYELSFSYNSGIKEWTSVCKTFEFFIYINGFAKYSIFYAIKFDQNTVLNFPKIYETLTYSFI